MWCWPRVGRPARRRPQRGRGGAGPAVLAEPPEAATREEDVGAAGPVAEWVATAREGPQAVPATSTAQASTIPGRAHRLRSTAAIVARHGAPARSGPHRWQAAN